MQQFVGLVFLIGLLFMCNSVGNAPERAVFVRICNCTHGVPECRVLYFSKASVLQTPPDIEAVQKKPYVNVQPPPEVESMHKDTVLIIIDCN